MILKDKKIPITKFFRVQNFQGQKPVNPPIRTLSIQPKIEAMMTTGEPFVAFIDNITDQQASKSYLRWYTIKTDDGGEKKHQKQNKRWGEGGSPQNDCQFLSNGRWPYHRKMKHFCWKESKIKYKFPAIKTQRLRSIFTNRWLFFENYL